MKRKYKEILYDFIKISPNKNIGLYQLGMIKLYHNDAAKGVPLIEKAATSYPYGFTFLGMAYLEGNLLVRDIRKGLTYLKKASEAGDGEAFVQLSNLYLNDKYFPINIKKAISLLQEGIKLQNAHAMFNLGFIYLDYKNPHDHYQESFALFTKASFLGSADANALLGFMYEEGLYVKRDYIKAFKYYLKATSGKSPIAHFFLGRFYHQGKLIKINIHEALEHYLLASSYGHLEATHKLIDIYFDEDASFYNPLLGKKYLQRLLLINNGLALYKYGKLILEGKHYPHDIKKGLKYLRKSNTSKAYELLGIIYSTNSFANKNYQLSLNYYLRAATLGNTNAMYKAVEIIISEDIDADFISLIENGIKLGNHELFYLYGKCYQFGWKVDIDLEKAYRFYKKSKSSQGYRAAGLCCLNGIGTEKNIKRAIYYLKKSINYNDKISPLILGRLYLFGKDVKNNINKGIEFLTIAANRNSAEAYYLLSTIFIEKDLPKAISLLKRAIQLGSYNAKILYKNLQEKSQQIF